MHTGFVQIPPDSTGKKLIHRHMHVLPYTNKTGDFELNELVVGVTSGAEGIVVAENAYASLVYIMTTRGYKYETISFDVGEDLQVSGLKVAEAGTGFDMHFPGTAVTSGDNPFNAQHVDAEGQAFVRFAEGAQLLDATGQSKVTMMERIGEYWADSTTMADDFSTMTIGSGSSTIDSQSLTIKLSVGTNLGDKVILQTDKYHAHPRGRGLLASMLVSLGDTGKAGLRRRWGYFDEYNGVFFELNETDQISIVQRSDSSGSVVDTIVSQNDWNLDQLDGTGLTSISLDLTKVNRYWWDTHDGDRVRAGTYGNARGRITANQFYNANYKSFNEIVNGWSLPLRAEMENIASTGSSSEMYTTAASVGVEGPFEPIRSFDYESAGNEHLVTSADWVPLVSFRPVALKNDKINRNIMLPRSISAFSVLNSDGITPAGIELGIVKNTTLTGDDWVAGSRPGSFFEIDKAATAMTGGTPLTEYFVMGSENIDCSSLTGLMDIHLCNKADGAQPIFTVAARALKQDVDVIAAMSWHELPVK